MVQMRLPHYPCQKNDARELLPTDKGKAQKTYPLWDFFDFVWHAIEIFCLGTQTALPFRILPRDRPPQDGKLD